MMRTVNIVWRSRRGLADVGDWVNHSVIDTLRRAGYEVQSMTSIAQPGNVPGTEWLLLHEERSSYRALVGLAAWWWGKSQYWVVISLSPMSDGRSELIIAGDMPGKITKVLQQLVEPVAVEPGVS